MNMIRRSLSKRNLILLCLSVFISFIFSCATVDTDTMRQRAGAHYKIGVSYLNEGKAQQAFVEFQRAYEINPKDKEVLYAIGIIYLLNFDETLKSIDYFQRATQIDPNFSDAYNNLGVAHFKLGKFEEAIPFYKKATANLLYMTPEKSFVGMGEAYYRLGKYSEAELSYKEAVKRAPNFDFAFLGLALCYNATGKYGDASAALSHAIAINPIFKGDQNKAAEYFTTRKISSSGYEQKDYADYLEIMKY